MASSLLRSSIAALAAPCRAAIITRTYVDIWDRLEAGDRLEAWRLFTRALPLIRFELQPGMGVSAMKHNLAAAGVIRSAHVRHPTVSLDARSLAELEFLRNWVASDAAAPV